MKRTLALFLALLMALALCACGGGAPTKEEMLENAETVTIDRLGKDFRTNVVNAKEKYVGKPFVVPGYVYEITEEGCILSISASNGSNAYFVKATIPADELKLLNTGDLIRVVGTITDEIVTAEHSVSGNTFTRNYINMENAYFVEEITEFTGTIGFNDNMYMETFITSEDAEKVLLINASDFGINLANIGDKITVSGSGIMEPRDFYDSYWVDFRIVLNGNTKVTKAAE